MSEPLNCIDVLLSGRLAASHGRILLNDLYLEDELGHALTAPRSQFGALAPCSWGEVFVRLVSVAPAREEAQR